MTSRSIPAKCMGMHSINPKLATRRIKHEVSFELSAEALYTIPTHCSKGLHGVYSLYATYSTRFNSYLQSQHCCLFRYVQLRSQVHNVIKFNSLSLFYKKYEYFAWFARNPFGVNTCPIMLTITVSNSNNRYQ